MSLTRNLCNDATNDLQRATATIRRLTALAAMGAHPTRDEYSRLHHQAVELNRAFRQLIRTLTAINAYNAEEDPPLTPNPD